MYKVDRLLTGLFAQQIGTYAQWYSNKTSLSSIYIANWKKYSKNIVILLLDNLKFGIVDTACIGLQDWSNYNVLYRQTSIKLRTSLLSQQSGTPAR